MQGREGSSECMKISEFMHGIINPELIKRLHDKIPKSVDEMMRVITTFLRGEVAASNREQKKSFPSWKQQEANQKQNFKKGGFRNQQRSERKQDRFTLFTKTPKEIFALDKGKIKAPPPMTTPVEKRNHAKFCEFHGEVGHNTDECMHLRKQIEEMLKVGKLSHLINELKQNNRKEQPKVKKKGETFGKDKAPRVSVKGQILADFIVERPEEDSLDTLIEVEKELPEPCILFTDGSSCTDGSGAGLILTNLEGMEFTYALRFRFDATNNEAEYEALIAGLRIAEQMGVKNLQANVKTLTSSFKAFSIRQVPRSENKKADALSKIASTSFAHLSKQVLVEELKEKSISEAEILAVVEEEGDTWMTPIFEYLTEETLPADEKKARAVRRKSQRFAVINGILYKKIFSRTMATVRGATPSKLRPKGNTRGILQHAHRFGLPGEIISDNRKQFQDNPFKDWCEKLCIRQHFDSVKHPQTNGLVERANRSLGEGIKARLGAKNKNWLEE
ncbi:reverse transcriptase domain-containing protein [Tanacetum coccineum]